MYYKHEFDNEKWFDDYDECRDDLLCDLDLDEYASRIDVKDILIHFSWRKNNEDFCNWFIDEIAKIEEMICNEFITELDDEEYEELCE